MNTKEYYGAITAMWRFLKKNLDDFESSGSPEWWNSVMSEAGSTLKPFKDSESREFALAFMVIILEELQQLRREKEGDARTGPALINVTYGTVSDALERIRKAGGVTEISFTDRNGQRKTSITIKS